jgi:CAAX prenyl protease-like protein
VIAVIEEFFWRGFVYRWLQKQAFLEVPLSAFRLGYFVVVVLLFGVEHDRWVVGILAGIAYGVLLLKTRDIWATAIAHGVTNLVIGVYVLLTGYHHFW